MSTCSKTNGLHLTNTLPTCRKTNGLHRIPTGRKTNGLHLYPSRAPSRTKTTRLHLIITLIPQGKKPAFAFSSDMLSFPKTHTTTTKNRLHLYRWHDLFFPAQTDITFSSPAFDFSDYKTKYTHTHKNYIHTLHLPVSQGS